MAIWDVIPITRPAASSSGPPELPGLIAASVWITWSMEKPLGASMRRCRADTTPVVRVRSRPKGLPIAIVGSPTCTWLESPSLVLLSESEGYWSQLKSLLRNGRIVGPQVHDARVAALCRLHGVSELWTADRDFSRFPRLRTVNPLI